MFERFTTDARQVVISAQDHARRLRHSRIGALHLLLGLAQQPAPTAHLLRDVGVTTAAVEAELRIHDARLSDADGAALAQLGIDLDAIRATAESRFGPGALDRGVRPQRRGPGRWFARRPVPPAHLPFTPGAKKTLELTLREAIRLGESRLTADHILLGLLGAEDRVADAVLTRLLARHGSDRTQLRTRVEAGRRRSA